MVGHRIFAAAAVDGFHSSTIVDGLLLPVGHGEELAAFNSCRIRKWMMLLWLLEWRRPSYWSRCPLIDYLDLGEMTVKKGCYFWPEETETLPAPAVVAGRRWVCIWGQMLLWLIAMNGILEHRLLWICCCLKLLDTKLGDDRGWVAVGDFD
ncbi:hypothetical protein ACLOJK_034259 [Asimina triloba]